ncbi:hypothetical protein JCM9534A_76340 [Catenuloplanes indicus JCM 9534]
MGRIGIGPVGRTGNGPVGRTGNGPVGRTGNGPVGRARVCGPDRAVSGPARHAAAGCGGRGRWDAGATW